MEILNFGPSGSSKKKSRNRVVLVLGAFALAAIGSTFAASITLNNGSAIQYGQGLQQATVCDSNITLAPANTFVNSTGSGAFYISSIAMYDTNTTSSSTGLAACTGKSLKITAYGDSSGTIIFQCTESLGAWSTGFGASSVTCATDAGSSSATSANLSTGGGVSNDGVTITFNGTLSKTAASIYKFTVESL